MEKDIVEGKIGEVGAYDLEFKEGKLTGKANLSHEPTSGITVKAEVSIDIGARPVLEALKKAAPGQIDDALFELLAKALGV